MCPTGRNDWSNAYIIRLSKASGPAIKGLLSGNDTIDRYPLCASGAVKILCITPKVWGEIYQAFEAFRRLIKGPAPRKVLEQAPRTKAKSVAKNERQTVYEPTNAIRCNDADWRRWARVKEWFNEYPPDTDAPGKTIENLKIWKGDQISCV